MNFRFAIAASALVLSCRVVIAGDAVVVGYNAEGVWTSATYYSSSTGPGGSDYKNEAAARDAATRDLKSRAGEGVVRTEVIGSSDLTAHVAYARGKKRRQDFHAVGYGDSDAEAQQKAFADLTRRGATSAQTVIYHYQTHGAEAREQSKR